MSNFGVYFKLYVNRDKWPWKLKISLKIWPSELRGCFSPIMCTEKPSYGFFSFILLRWVIFGNFRLHILILRATHNWPSHLVPRKVYFRKIPMILIWKICQHSVYLIELFSQNDVFVFSVWVMRRLDLTSEMQKMLIIFH